MEFGLWKVLGIHRSRQATTSARTEWGKAGLALFAFDGDGTDLLLPQGSIYNKGFTGCGSGLFARPLLLNLCARPLLRVLLL